MKKLILPIAVSFLVLSVALALAASGPEVITLKAKMGNVTFNHAQHQSKIADCTECHHKGTETPKCTGCHGVIKAAPEAKKAFHEQCKGCHKKSGGPAKCKECHMK